MLDRDKTLVIKIGSSVLLKRDGSVDELNLRKIVKQITLLRKNTYKVVLVVSGAVASGLGITGNQKISNPSYRQLFAGIGQAYLTTCLWNAFQKNHITIAQLLLTKDGLKTPSSKSHLKKVLIDYLEKDIAPVLNENDVIALNCFHGNDYLAREISTLLEAKRLIILTDVDGLLNLNKSGSFPINKITKVTEAIRRLAKPFTNPNGIGGMRTKVAVASLLQKKGIETVIANGNTPNILIRLLVKKEPIGTSFVVE